MRDLLVMGIVVIAVVAALRRPWIGVLLWVWVSIMNPHRFTYGFAYSAPVAAIAAGVTLLGLLYARQKSSPLKGAPMKWLALFVVWITVSWAMGLDPSADYEQWTKVMKILLMVFVGMALLHSKQHIFAFAWVVTGSMALLGIKGGVFTLLTGGGYHVRGPPGSFIEENNSLGLALVMTIPLLRFLQMQLATGRARHLMTAAMVLCGASALGSQSRGALLALAAMVLLLWWRGRNRVLAAIVIVLVAVSLVSFMPDTWFQRMETIGTYQEDKSAMGRIAAWTVAWRLAFDYPFGVGFNAARPELFAHYWSGMNVGTPVAHSIYFQVLGHHGFIGLGIYLCLWISTWRTAAAIRRRARDLPAQAKWCADLAGMSQVAMIGFAVGGAFLSLSYFDLPYNIMMLLVLTSVWMQRRAWETEPAYVGGRFRIPGLAGLPPAATTGAR